MTSLQFSTVGKYALIPFTVSTAIFPRWNVTEVERIERIFFDPSRKCLTEDFSTPFVFPSLFFPFFFSNSIGRWWDQLCLRAICRNNLMLEIFFDRTSKWNLNFFFFYREVKFFHFKKICSSSRLLSEKIKILI